MEEFASRLYLLACHYSLPVINEDQAREALLQYVAQNCCYGSGAAKNMTFRDLKSSSAFHVCVHGLSLELELQGSTGVFFRPSHCADWMLGYNVMLRTTN